MLLHFAGKRYGHVVVGETGAERSLRLVLPKRLGSQMNTIPTKFK